jgi:hypothetical protein
VTIRQPTRYVDRMINVALGINVGAEDEEEGKNWELCQTRQCDFCHENYPLSFLLLRIISDDVDCSCSVTLHLSHTHK